MTKFPGCFLFMASLIVLLAAVDAPGQVTVQIGQDFTGTTYGVNSQALPPDPNGVIGPTRFMEFVNGAVAVYNRTNGISVQRKTDIKFWSDAGLIISPDSGVSDPRVIYDPMVQRWFATQVDFDATANDPTTEGNDFLLAVSTTSSPTGPWKGFLIPADPDNGYFADFPTLGVDSNAVYISGDFYSSSLAMGPGLLSIPKADLIAATPTIANMTWYGVMDYGVRGDVLQPAVCFDGSASGSILAMGDIGSDSTPHSNVVWFAVQNAGGTTPTLSPSASLTVAPYEVPDNDLLGVPQFTALQPDNTSTLQANDPRLAAKVFAVGGVLYAVHNTELNGRIAIRWYRIRAADHTLLEQGTIADPNLDLFFPSIAANQYGTVMICCDGSGLGTYISNFAYAGQTVNGRTTFGSGILLQSGIVSYHDLNEVYGDLLDMPVTSRWGDYSTLSVDPNDPTQFWTIQMYPSDEDSDLGTGVWSTKIIQLIATAPPQLTITPSGTNVLISWPLYAANYQLFSATSLNQPVTWNSVSQPTVTNGLQISVTLAQTGSQNFYRLQK
jgi:hypothetical protein